ncbi:MAG: phage portal protein [Ruminococcus flavefaciens]|nr:phage portal protein [Ruminococcus flavefaciens]
MAAERKAGMYIKGNADVILRSDIETRYQAYGETISSGFIKISEVRKKEELPFVNGTDRLIIGNGASIPLENLGRQYGGDDDKKI